MSCDELLGGLENRKLENRLSMGTHDEFIRSDEKLTSRCANVRSDEVGELT